MSWLVLVLVLIMLIAAIAVLILPNMIAAVVASSVVSLTLTIIFAILKAPDVAMTEAAIGVGLGSLILAIGLKRLGYWSLSNSGDSSSGEKND
jgi:energy-converting hydrogenase B subunit D